VGLLDQKGKLAADALIQAGVHGFDKMLLGLDQILEVIGNEVVQLVLFFEQETKHVTPRQNECD
jgi:hypothetical protein